MRTSEAEVAAGEPRPSPRRSLGSIRTWRAGWAWALGLAGIVLMVLVVLAAAAFMASRRAVPVPAHAPQVNSLHAACVADMVANTCKVMSTGPTAVTARPGEQVFIAGVGAVPATDYQQMFAAGDAMCAVVSAACTRDWGSAQCLTARRVFGGV